MIAAIVGLWRALVVVPQRIVDWLDPYAGHEEVIQQTGYARGGVIRGLSDPSDDRVTYRLSDGHGWVRPMTREVFGEDGLKRLLGVDHIHPLRNDCREMPTRHCPPSYGATGCGERLCARLESDDEAPWLAAERLPNDQ